MTEPLSEKKKAKLLDKALLAEMGIDREELKRLKKKLYKAEGKPERGIETWYRLTSKNLYTRLQIIDTKANILITANTIIISVVLGTLYPRLADDPHMIYAVGGMIVTNILSIAFAILATIPDSAAKARTKMGEADLMTFDGFYTMPLEVYRDSVMHTLEQDTTLYPSIIQDIHTLGLTLAKKYKLIRSSYMVFLYGIIISVALFGACHLLF